MLGALIGAAVSGIGGILGSSSAKKQAKATEAAGAQQAEATRYAADKAAETARLGFDYLTASPVANYLTVGADANAQQAALLGLGGDVGAAETGFQNFLNSTGFDFAQRQGNRALIANAGVAGLRGSGATGRAFADYNRNMGLNYFTNYLGQLGQLSAQGLSAGGVIGGAASQAGAQGAQAIAQGYGQAAGAQAAGQVAGADLRAQGRNTLYEGIGGAAQGLWNVAAPKVSNALGMKL